MAATKVSEPEEESFLAVPEVPEPEPETVLQESTNREQKQIWGFLGYGLVIFGAGYGIGKNEKQLIRALANGFRSMRYLG